MADDLELQNQIAQLAGRINRHKTNESQHSYAAPSQYTYGGAGSYYAGGGVEIAPSSSYYSGWIPQRGAPYGVPRGRGRGARAAPHRNRTLVLKSASSSTPGAAAPQESSGFVDWPSEATTPAGWVSKRDRHMQLINNSVYEKKTQQRNEAIEATRQQKRLQHDEREKARINKHFQALQPQVAQYSTTKTTPHQIYVQDIRFLVADGGSKLLKAPDEANLVKVTPKRAHIGGVTFFRSKRGNLYRAGLVKSKRDRDGVTKLTQPCPQFSTTGRFPIEPVSLTSAGLAPLGDERPLTSQLGSCPKGPLCRYQHDASKVAICRDFLLSGKCPAGEDCDLSHDPTPERVPACLHFIRGNCTNPECRYAHVRTNPGAPVCRAFATLGYCSKGISCTERHVHECPDYANKGICHRKNCRLPHVDRAGQLRKAAARVTAPIQEDESSDVSSDEELADMDSDDFDSDGMEEEMLVPASAEQRHELSQQVDYVQF